MAIRYNGKVYSDAQVRTALELYDRKGATVPTSEDNGFIILLRKSAHGYLAAYAAGDDSYGGIYVDFVDEATLKHNIGIKNDLLTIPGVGIVTIEDPVDEVIPENIGDHPGVRVHLFQDMNADEVSDTVYLVNAPWEDEREAFADAMPDPSVTLEQLKEYGYLWRGMLPLRMARAKELWDEGAGPIFRLYEDNTEGEVDSEEEFAEHDSYGGLFGIGLEEWDFYFRKQKGEFTE